MLCKICEGKDIKRVSTAVRHSKNPDLKVYECYNCETQFLHPFNSPEELKEFYDKEYRNVYTNESIDEFYNMSLPQAKQRVERVRKYLGCDDDILEVGCASGFFLSAVEGFVKKACGCEWDLHYGNYARNLGFDIKMNPVDFDIQFNSIFMFHVLEHIHNPIQFLEGLKHKLKKDGKIFIEVPNRDDALIQLFDIQEFKDFYYQTAHLWYFNKKSLEYLLDLAGYHCTIIPIQRYDLSNHLIWLKDRKPGGNGFFNGIFSDSLKSEYESTLKSSGMTDTIMAVASVR